MKRFRMAGGWRWLALLVAMGLGLDAAAGEMRYVQYGYELENGKNVSVSGVIFRAYAPVKETTAQRTVRVKTMPEAETVVDVEGNQMLCFSVGEIPPYGKKMISIEAEIEMGEEQLPTNFTNGHELKNRTTKNPAADASHRFGAGTKEKREGSKAEDGQRTSSFLNPERFIESDHIEIQQVADKLGGTDVTATAKAALDWVHASIRHAGLTSQDLGALWALRNRKGDCTEMSYLFVALCRARGIPARVIGGYPCDRNMKLQASTYHNWAEFFDGTTWQLVDPQFGRFMEDEDKYLAMRIFTTNTTIATFHQVQVEGDGVEVRMSR